MAEETRPTSRATARRDRFAPPVARCRLPGGLISSIISARPRARIEPAGVDTPRLLHTLESTALANADALCDYLTQERALLSRQIGDRDVAARDRRSRTGRHRNRIDVGRA